MASRRRRSGGGGGKGEGGSDLRIVRKGEMVLRGEVEADWPSTVGLRCWNRAGGAKNNIYFCYLRES